MLVVLILALSSLCTLGNSHHTLPSTAPAGSHFSIEVGGRVLAQDRLFWVPEEVASQAHTATRVETEIEPESHGNAERSARPVRWTCGSLAHFFALASCTAAPTAVPTDDVGLQVTEASILVLYHVFRI